MSALQYTDAGSLKIFIQIIRRFRADFKRKGQMKGFGKLKCNIRNVIDRYFTYSLHPDGIRSRREGRWLKCRVPVRFSLFS